MDYGFTNLQPKALEQIEGNDFEEFCEELLRFERDKRHPGADVAGPAPRMVGDGGKDLRLTTTVPPSVAKPFFSDALTEDHIGETYFSCKGGNDWATAMVKDVGDQDGPLEVLARGGHFTILLHRKADLTKATVAFGNAVRGTSRRGKSPKKVKGASPKNGEQETATFREAIEATLQRRLKVERSITLSDLATRIHVYDASHLASFLKRHRPSISARFASQLGIRRLEYLLSSDEWEKALRAERGFPSYVADAERFTAIATIRVLLTAAAGTSADRVVWVHGPPGVGKSRMVLEAIQSHDRAYDLRRRAVIARSDTDGSAALSAGVTEHASDSILVIDECPAETVTTLAASFLAKVSTPSNATLVMIGPRPRPDHNTSPSIRSFRVQPLDEEAGRDLVVSTLGIDPATDSSLVERVLRLCEGYPWSAVLVAQALRHDRNALPERATHWDACELALCSRQHGTGLLDWHAETLRRARAILGVMLTDGIDWATIGQQTMERVARAVGLTSSADLSAAAYECDNRGLLRRRLEWKYKYVTPNNIARQVAIHLLSGPHYAARSIREHCRELMPSLHRQLGGLDVPQAILQSMADDELSALDDDPPDLFGVARGALGGTALTFVAAHRPARTAALLRRLVERGDDFDWTANSQAALILGGALADLARRRDSFDDGEEALYRLAVYEARVGLASSVDAWRSLFLVRLNPTYLPYEVRLARLHSRLERGEGAEKILVLRALEVALSEHESRSGEPTDGPWHRPSRGEAAKSSEAAWRTLFEVVLDADADVAAAARKAVTKHLRAAVRTGLGEAVLQLLVRSLSSWPVSERSVLREAVDLISQYDADWLERDAAIKLIHASLLESLQPKSFHDRLVDAVGRWRPWQGKTSFEDGAAFIAAHDEELAREGLQGEAPIVTELAWLASKEAKRRGAFMIALGRADTKRTLLARLESGCDEPTGADLVAGYLAGVAEVGGANEVDAALRRWRGVSRLALASFLTICRVGPSTERIAWLIEDIEQGRLNLQSLHSLTFTSWGRKAPALPIQSLASALLKTEAPEACTAALSMLLARVEASPDTDVTLLDAVADAVMALARVPEPDTMLAYEWELACAQLAKRGRPATAIAAAMLALESSGRIGYAERVWTVLQPLFSQHGSEIWTAMTKLLEPSIDLDRILLDVQGSGLLSHVPSQDILTWIGSDRRRQIMIAEMCDTYDAPLNPLARSLISRYGASSAAASVLEGRVHSTPRPVSSLAHFAREQLEKAAIWAADTDEQVAQWGARMVQQLQQAAEEFDAHEEYERRQRS